MKTAGKRVRGLGSAGGGTGTFIAERFTSVALLLLTPFVIGFVIRLAGSSYEEAVAFLGSPIVASILAGFILMSVEHMRMGMRMIIEDYVHGRTMLLSLLVLNTLFSWGCGLVAILSLLKIAL